MMLTTTADVLRSRFTEYYGLDYTYLTDETIYRLAYLMDECFKKKGNHDPTLTVKAVSINYRNHDIISAEITVQSDWFDEREGITFNRNGFIGFCGWASSQNAEPIYHSFTQWMEDLVLD